MDWIALPVEANVKPMNLNGQPTGDWAFNGQPTPLGADVLQWANLAWVIFELGRSDSIFGPRTCSPSTSTATACISFAKSF